MLTYLQNLVKLTSGDYTLMPRLAVYYVTLQCNLNCTYCEDFGSRRNHRVTPNPTLEDAKQILKVIRTGMDRLWLTGGEPLMAPHLLDLLQYARHDLKFREISLITNGTLLNSVIASATPAHSAGAKAARVARRANSDNIAPVVRCRGAIPPQTQIKLNNQTPDLFSLLDRLIISLDSTDPQALNIVSVPTTYVETVLVNARETASLQQKYNFKLVLNAVITPETLPGMEKLLDFCVENKAWISFSPQSVNNMPRYELITSSEYQALIEKLVRLKKQGAPILGSFSYLKTLLNQTPYECYPTLVPRIMPDGWLVYPCRPMEKAGGEQGGQAINLLHVQTWEQAWKIATEKYGEAPTSCVSCFQQCYAEPSLMQAHPFEYLFEKVRGYDPGAYAPG